MIPDRGRIPAMARSDSFVETLATVPLFSACSKKELQLVAKSADQVTYPAGNAVVTEGAAGSEFFVILEGRRRSRLPRTPETTLAPAALSTAPALRCPAP